MMNGKFHTLYFEATRNCNFSCKYCSTGSSKSKECTDADYQAIVDNIFVPAKNLGTKFIDFSGGEFLLRNDSLKLLQTAINMGFSVGIVSNGTTLNNEKLQQLKDIAGEELIISLGINSFDSDNKVTRDNHYTNTIKLIEKISKFGFKINISVTIGEFNKKSFADTIKKISDMSLAFNRIPFSIRNCNVLDLMITTDSMKNYFHPVLRNYFNGQISYVPFFLPPDSYNTITKSNVYNDELPLNPSVGCWVGSYYSINPEGEVSPCPLFGDQISGGNVFKENLKDILFESELFKKILNRKNFKGKCGNCKYTLTCGGCRVMAYFLNGDPYAEDPICFIDKLSNKEIEAIEKETVKSFKNYNRMIKIRNLLINKDS